MNFLKMWRLDRERRQADLIRMKKDELEEERKKRAEWDRRVINSGTGGLHRDEVILQNREKILATESEIESLKFEVKMLAGKMESLRQKEANRRRKSWFG